MKTTRDFTNRRTVPHRISPARESPIRWQQILSAAMMLRYSLNMGEQADRIEKAVKKVLADGLRTGDIYEDGTKRVGTKEMGDAVVAAL